MLKRVDPSNPVLQAYLKTFDSSIPTGILLPREEKKTNKSKKAEPSSPEKKAKGSTLSKSPKKKPENVVVTVEATQVITPIVEESQENVVIHLKTRMFRRIKMKSTHKRKSSSQKLLRKPQLFHQGVLFREVPVSPASKKRTAEDMAKHLSQPKKKKTKKARKIVSSKTTVIVTPEVSIAKSIFGEVRTSGLGENVLKDAYQGPFISTPFESLVFVTPTSNTPLTSTTISPTFEHIINQPITSMFSYQSTDTPKPTSPTETDHEGFGGTFKDLEFHDEEEDFPDHMLMTMKQYKI
ncbi:unnamed protein product [Lactuca saligna]|uniref:Uncharacterized protein n=1 Tax=Lactuca saligna TaxID=75948 RepID=A0AA35YE92_LACSI|nr:unnamed protein product [Lactuca saligna]